MIFSHIQSYSSCNILFILSKSLFCQGVRSRTGLVQSMWFLIRTIDSQRMTEPLRELSAVDIEQMKVVIEEAYGK